MKPSAFTARGSKTYIAYPMKSYLLCFNNDASPQSAADLCFIGGRPNLPAELPLPICHLCKSPQTFFFQVAFPLEHAWSGLSLALFACTRCYHERCLGPNEVKRTRSHFDIPEGFFDGCAEKMLDGYDLNFRFVAFSTVQGHIRNDYQEKVKFKRWTLEPARTVMARGDKVGGRPRFIQGTKIPRSYAGRYPMVFLMQLEEEREYEILPEAPGQVEYNYFEKRFVVSEERSYRLFVGNALYLFGTLDAPQPLVYAVTQSS